MDEVRHLAIEFHRRLTALIDITQYQGLGGLRSILNSAVHEVQGNVERVDIAVIRVVDECQSTLSLLYLQAHGDRFQMSHPPGNLFGRQSQVECHSGTGNRVLDTCLINIGEFIAPFHTFIYIGNAVTFCLYKHGSLVIVARPADTFALILRTTHTSAHRVVIRRIDDDLRVAKQLQLLHTFLVHIAEVLLMGAAQRCQHTDGGLNDVVQSQHLPRLTDTCLKQSNLGLLIQQPYGQRHANLRIIALGRAGHFHRRHQYLVEPLLDPRFTVRTRDAHHRDVEFITMTLSQSLQGCQRRGYLEEICIWEKRLIVSRFMFYHKRADTTTIEFIDIFMSIITFGAQGEKQGLLGETQRTAVCQQPTYSCLFFSITACSYQSRHLFYCINHSIQFYY